MQGHVITKVAKALVVTNHSMKLAVFLCLYFTYSLFEVKVRSPSENKHPSNLSSQQLL